MQSSPAESTTGATLDFGIGPQQFRERHFEQRPFLQKAALARRQFEWTDIDALLYQVEPVAPFIQLFNSGLVPEDIYTEDAVDFGLQRRRLKKTAFYGQMRSGATLVMNRLENFSLPAKHLCQEVSRFAAHQASGNAYLTFGGSGTFDKHWDVHDVFAIQLLGRKRWKIFAPTLPLPLAGQTSESHRNECPAQPVMDVTLEAGDLLYLPRGWWHQVIPLDEGSFHLSVGVYAPTVFDYLLWACNRYLPQIAAARNSLSADAKGVEAVAAALKYLTAAMGTAAPIAEYSQGVAARERLNSEFNVSAFLESGQERIASDAVLTLNGSASLQNSAAEIAVNGLMLRLTPLSKAILKLLGDSPALRFDALCGKLAQVPLAAVQASVLDLARYDVVTIRSG